LVSDLSQLGPAEREAYFASLMEQHVIISKIILKTLYKEKSVETIKVLNDKVLEQAAKHKITVSEKIINSIIHNMDETGKIEFTQKEGWKIKI
jgi:hypothetical protein